MFLKICDAWKKNILTAKPMKILKFLINSFSSEHLFVCLFVCLFLFVLSMLQKQTLDVAKLRYDHTMEGE